MKKLVIQLFVGMFLLCCGFQAVAQTPITEYKEKIADLSAISPTAAQILDNRINGVSGAVFVNAEGQADKYEVAGEVLKVMYLKTANDFTSLTNANGNALQTISVLHIEWDAVWTFTFPQNLKTILPDLEFVYIRSYENLTSSLIANAFQTLLTNLDYDEDGIEVLFTTMEQPQ